MAPTLVAAAIGAILAVALLGAAFDRRAVAVVVAAAVFPDLDAAASLVVPGATNALFHAVWLPLVAGVALYWDTAAATDSRLRARFGWRGVRVAWVALAAALVAGIGPSRPLSSRESGLTSSAGPARTCCTHFTTPTTASTGASCSRHGKGSYRRSSLSGPRGPDSSRFRAPARPPRIRYRRG